MNPVEQSDRHVQWKKLVEEQEKSSLSQTAFCKQRNLVYSTFIYRREVIKAKARNDVENTKLFSAVQVKKVEVNSSVEIRIVLPNGFQCFVPCHVEVSHVKRLMEAMLAC